jgi:hypothetical protein
MRPQVNEVALSPQFSEKRFLGILLIDLPIGIGTLALGAILFIGLFRGTSDAVFCGARCYIIRTKIIAATSALICASM